MILYLFKPFGGDNYLALSKPEELQKFFQNLTPGDEFMLRVLELSDDEYSGLDDFQGFSGSTSTDDNDDDNAQDSSTSDDDTNENPDDTTSQQ